MSGATLVTGATGFLGSHLCATLCEREGRIGATRRASSDVSGLDGLSVEWHEADVLDREAVRSAVEGYDRVYHLAGVGLQAAGPETVRRVNREGTRNVLEAARDAGVDRVVFTSTAGTRRSETVADESDVATPIGAYQVGKAAAERIANRVADGETSVVTVHPTSVFGPHDAQFTGRLLGLVADPKAIVHPPGGASIVGVDDVVDGLVAAMDRGRAGEHYILGGQNLPYADALEILAAETGGAPPRFELPDRLVHAAGLPVELANRALDVRLFPFSRRMARLSTQKLFYSSEKATAELGYDPAPVRDVVGDAWDWYRSAEL